MKKAKRKAGGNPAAKSKKGRRKQQAVATSSRRTTLKLNTQSPLPSATDQSRPSDTSDFLTSEAATALDQGKPGRALNLAKRALMSIPDDVDALNLAGVASAQLGDMAEAQSFFETVIAFDPGHVRGHMNLGNLLRDGGDADGASEVYQKALALAPTDVAARFNLAVLQERMGRFDQAEASLRAVLSVQPGYLDARFHLANIAKARGFFGQSLAAYDALIKDHPRHTDAWVNRGAVLQELSRPLEAMESFRKALSIDPQHLDARYNLALALQETGSFVEAAQTYEALLHDVPDHVGARVNLGFVHRSLGNLDAALTETKAAADAAPDFDKAHVNLGDLYSLKGETDAALDVARGYLARHPANPSMLAFLGIALSEAGDEQEAQRLMNLAGLIHPVQISPPAAYSGLDAFNQALADHVRAHPSLPLSPASHATRKGRHSGELLDERPGPVGDLADLIMNAMPDAFDCMCKACPDHPALSWQPDDPALSIWGVVMEDEGHQLPHIHPSAWISGVYYPEIPAVVREDDPTQQGWIEFGQPPDDFHTTNAPHLKLFKPVEGLMLLFPSFLYHRTIPFSAPTQRMSIAFDFVPRR